jgi:cytochrome c-type biogenesis protein CcmH/NrfG
VQIENLKGMLEKNPADTEHWIMLGNLYYDIGKFAQALEPYEKALLLAPANENVRVDYAVCLFNSGQDGRAIQELEKVVLANPNHQTATYNLGVIHLHAGNKDRARQYWNRTLQINATSDLASKARDALDRLK